MIAAAGLLLLVLGGLLVPLASSTAHHTYDEARNAEMTAASVLAAQVSDPVARVASAVSESPHPGQTLTAPVGAVVRATGMRVLIVDRHRRVLADSTKTAPLGRALARPDRGLQQVLAERASSPQPVAHGIGDELVVTVPVLEAGSLVGAVEVARPLSDVRAQTRSRDLALAGLGLLALVFGITVAALLATRVVRPVRRLGDVARRFGRGDLDVRAPRESIRELGELSETFNAMADALAAHVTAQQEFAANASHQLKTPLTGLQLRLEAIATANGEIDVPDEARKALMDVGRLNALTEDLLQLARATAPVQRGERIELGALVENVVERWTETSSRRAKPLHLELRDAAVVRADPDDLEHLLDNLIDNAMRYSPDGAHIDVEVSGGTVSVANDGPGIPADEQTRIFERFYRGRRGRAVAPGTGLGLAVVGALAARWGGEVRLVPDVRTRFEVQLPAEAPAAGRSRGPGRRSALFS